MADRKQKKQPARKPKPPVIPPEKRGRRGHKAVDTQPGLREWLVGQLQRTPRPTLDEIMDGLKSTGFSIGRTAVWEFRVAREVELAERDLMLDLAKRYAAIGGDDPLALETAIATALNVKLLRDVQSAIAFDPDQAKTFARMQSSASARERTKSGRERTLRRAIESVRQQLEERLGRNPAALKVVLEELAKVEAG